MDLAIFKCLPTHSLLNNSFQCMPRYFTLHFQMILRWGSFIFRTSIHLLKRRRFSHFLGACVRPLWCTQISSLIPFSNEILQFWHRAFGNNDSFPLELIYNFFPHDSNLAKCFSTMVQFEVNFRTHLQILKSQKFSLPLIRGWKLKAF